MGSSQLRLKLKRRLKVESNQAGKGSSRRTESDEWFRSEYDRIFASNEEKEDED